MATLTFKYPVKINGKVYKAGEAVDEQSVAEGVKSETGETTTTSAPPNNSDGEETGGDDNGADVEETGGDDNGADVELTGMTLEQLKKFAKDNGFDIKGCTTKAQIIEAIEKA